MISRAVSDILYISRCFNTCQKQLRTDDALFPSQYRVISHVVRKPGCNQEDLIVSSGMDKTTMTHRLQSLEENGYIRREVSPEDARCRLVFPTEKALGIYPAIHSQYENFTERILRDLSEEDILLLTRLTEKIRENAAGLLTELSDTGKKKKQGGTEQ